MNERYEHRSYEAIETTADWPAISNGISTYDLPVASAMLYQLSNLWVSSVRERNESMNMYI